MGSEMQLESWGSRNALVEGAKEELEILEFHHPNKFLSLKMELKTLISDLESHYMVSTSTSASCPSAATQESSSRKKRKKVGSCGSMKRIRCIKSTDAVLERAQQCLHKIQHFKNSLAI